MNDPQTKFQRMFQDLSGSPQLSLQQIDWANANCLFIEADEDFYRDAAFLDDRTLTPNSVGAWMPLKVVAAKVAEQQSSIPRCDFIFHIGHCGSTLISRILGYSEGVLCLREPMTLRSLAEMELRLSGPGGPDSEEDFAASLAIVYRLLARRFEGQTHVVVKATSFCSSLGPRLMALNPGNRALLVGMAPEVYIAAMLGAGEYVADVRKTADHRLSVLNNLVGENDIRLAGLSDAALVALSWATEILSLDRIADRVGLERAQYVDFDAFLADRDANCLNICAHFGLPAGDDYLRHLNASGVFGQYSKATDYAFGTQARQQRLDESRSANAAAIVAGLDYLKRIAGETPPIAEAARRFGYDL